MINQLKCYRKNTFNILLETCDYTFENGDTLYFTVKKTPDSDETDDSAFIKRSFVVGTDTSENDDGIITLQIPADETDIDYGGYFYDIKAVKTNGNEQTLVTGDFSVLDVATLRA